ncbi:MAG: hypothetical protein M3290_04180, partial [Actinomycetota bacterium]|nr:hypothetical protein [Actinomycetota bacterium]
MAARIEHLQRIDLDARIYRFPAAALRRRRRARIARRRLTVGTLLLVFVAAFLIASGPAGVSPASTSHAPRAVTIHPGQTLWDIAARYARSGADPRT